MSFRNYYDTSYNRSRTDGRVNSSGPDRPTTVTAKYTSISPSYKSSSIPVLSRDRSATRETETPISAIASRYTSYKPKEDKPKYTDRKETYSHNRLTVPGSNHSRDASPVSNSSRYNLNRSPRALSPDRRNLKTPTILSKSRDVSPKEKEKDIPCRNNDKTSYSSGYSTYKIYPRTSSYTRPITKTEIKPEITINRYGTSNQLSSSYLRGSSTGKISPAISPNNYGRNNDEKFNNVIENETIKIEEKPESVPASNSHSQNDNECETEEKFETITVITRHTSPTPPGSSAYVRTRRADMAKTVEKKITRSNKRPPMSDKEIQSDRLDDPTRNSRFGSTARTNLSTWSSYNPSSSKYCGYAGRFSTQYVPREHSEHSNSRESSTSRVSVSDRTEKNSVNNCNCDNSYKDAIISAVSTNKNPNNNKCEQHLNEKNMLSHENNPEVVTTYKENEDDETSEIIINVNLKLKKAKPSSSQNPTDMVSPEVTITNSQLPPQGPKTDATVKVKKSKTKKSTVDSKTEPKKKVIKRRKSSSSSIDSDQSTDRSSIDKSPPDKESSLGSPPSLSRTPSVSSNIAQNELTSNVLLRHKIRTKNSRDSNSPDSTVTISTQTSCSDDDIGSKSKSSKTNEASRTSADEISFPLDKSAKFSPPPYQKVEPTTDEAKSFLIRALAPVTNFFKLKQQETNENSSWLENTSESTSNDAPNISTESDRSNNKETEVIHENKLTMRPIRHIESGERAWWLDSESDNKTHTRNVQSSESSEKKAVKKMSRVESGERAWWLDANGESHNTSTDITRSSEQQKKAAKPRYSNHDSDEKPWWLDSQANIPDGVERLSPVKKSESERSDKFDFYKIRHIDSGEKEWWHLSDSEKLARSNSKEKSNDQQQSKSSSDCKSNFPLRKIKHADSGERPWWLSSSKNVPEGIEKLPTPSPPPESESSLSEEVQEYVLPQKIPSFPLSLPDDEPLGDRRSPEGLETPCENENYLQRLSPYENTNYRTPETVYRKHSEKFVSRYTDIDDIFGTSGQMYSPFMDSILARRTGQGTYEGDFSDCEEIDPTQVRIHDSTPQHPVIKKLRCRSEIIDCRDENQLDDAALQIYKNNDYGVYLDLDSTLGEQQEELEQMRETRGNSIVLRTQLSVRVHAIIEKLREAEGRDLRKALFSLKQVLQRDKDLVHEFVENEGLDCLMSVGTSDLNYLEYVLRALGQIVLYVDGMHGVMHHKTCVQWLYSLLSNPFRHIVKNCLKLLMVFVEYNDMNCTLLINAINTVDNAEGKQPWENIMKILKDFDASDTELLIYAMTLINRCLNNAASRDVYYDQVDALEDQGLDDIIKLYMSKQGTDLDLLRQFQIYEAVLSYEDGDETGTALKQLDDTVIKLVGKRRSSLNTNQLNRRKSKKRSMKDEEDANYKQDRLNSKNFPQTTYVVKEIQDEKEKAIRRRRERFARQNNHIIQQQELFTNCVKNVCVKNIIPRIINDEKECLDDYDRNQNINEINGIIPSKNGLVNRKVCPGKEESFLNIDSSNCNGVKNSKDYSNSNNDIDMIKSKIIFNGGLNNLQKSNTNGYRDGKEDVTSNICRSLKNMTIGDVLHGSQKYTAGLKQRIQNGTLGHSLNAKDALIVIRKKTLESNLESNEFQDQKDHRIINTAEEGQSRVAEMAGLLMKAKEGLAKSQSKDIIKSPPIPPPKPQVSENEIQWEELRKGLNRAYHICDLDFSDLMRDEDDVFSTASKMGNGVPPPPLPPPPLMYNFNSSNAPPPPPSALNPPQPFRLNLNNSNASNSSASYDDSSIKKNKKTVKLFWKEINDTPIPPNLKKKVGSIWDDLPDVNVDTDRLEHLFESRSNDLLIKKLNEPKKTLILDAKRSNAINICMKKLPKSQALKAAIMKMDATVIGREGIEKLLTMIPTEEEKIKIQEAQYANPDLPLGNAEQFLLSLASITELPSRLKLWLFKLDFENVEKEIAEPLLDLKQGIELLKVNATFKAILSTLRSVGSFLNGTQVKGFRLEYLSKVMEVKDTVHKHPLLYHVCEMIIQKFPDSSDFFSEVGPIIRASKEDFDALKQTLAKLEVDCKSSWDHLKKVAKHDGPMIAKTRINEFLTDAAERIILLGIIEKKVMNRYNQFLLYIGVPMSEIPLMKPTNFLKILSEFALEYMTTRERVLQQLEKKANHRERNKTRGKLIIESGNYSNKNADVAADAALRELLMTDGEDSSAVGRKKFLHKAPVKSELQTPDQVLENLVKSSIISHRKPRRRGRLGDKLSVDRSIDTK